MAVKKKKAVRQTKAQKKIQSGMARVLEKISGQRVRSADSAW